MVDFDENDEWLKSMESELGLDADEETDPSDAASDYSINEEERLLINSVEQLQLQMREALGQPECPERRAALLSRAPAVDEASSYKAITPRTLKQQYKINTAGYHHVTDVVLDRGRGMGLVLADNDSAETFLTTVHGFARFPDGTVRPAEECGMIRIGDVLLKVDEIDVTAMPYTDVLQQIQNSRQEVKIQFGTPPSAAACVDTSIAFREMNWQNQDGDSDLSEPSPAEEKRNLQETETETIAQELKQQSNHQKEQRQGQLHQEQKQHDQRQQHQKPKKPRDHPKQTTQGQKQPQQPKQPQQQSKQMNHRQNQKHTKQKQQPKQQQQQQPNQTNQTNQAKQEHNQKQQPKQTKPIQKQRQRNQQQIAKQQSEQQRQQQNQIQKHKQHKQQKQKQQQQTKKQQSSKQKQQRQQQQQSLEEQQRRQQQNESQKQNQQQKQRMLQLQQQRRKQEQINLSQQQNQKEQSSQQQQQQQQRKVEEKLQQSFLVPTALRNLVLTPEQIRFAKQINGVEQILVKEQSPAGFVVTVKGSSGGAVHKAKAILYYQIVDVPIPNDKALFFQSTGFDLLAGIAKKSGAHHVQCVTRDIGTVVRIVGRAETLKRARKMAFSIVSDTTVGGT